MGPEVFYAGHAFDSVQLRRDVPGTHLDTTLQAACALILGSPNTVIDRLICPEGRFALPNARPSCEGRYPGLFRVASAVTTGGNPIGPVRGGGPSSDGRGHRRRRRHRGTRPRPRRERPRSAHRRGLPPARRTDANAAVLGAPVRHSPDRAQPRQAPQVLALGAARRATDARRDRPWEEGQPGCRRSARASRDHRPRRRTHRCDPRRRRSLGPGRRTHAPRRGTGRPGPRSVPGRRAAARDAAGRVVVADRPLHRRGRAPHHRSRPRVAGDPQLNSAATPAYGVPGPFLWTDRPAHHRSRSPLRTAATRRLELPPAGRADPRAGVDRRRCTRPERTPS